MHTLTCLQSNAQLRLYVFKERHLIKLNSLQRHIFSVCAWWAAIFTASWLSLSIDFHNFDLQKPENERARLAEREIKKKANPGGARPVVAHRCGRSCIHGGVHGHERTALSCRRPNKPKKSESILKLHQHDLQTSKFAAPGCTGTRLKVVTSIDYLGAWCPGSPQMNPSF